MDIRQSESYANFLKEIGWDIEKINGIYFFVKKIPLLGSAIKVQRTKNLPVTEVEILLKKYRVFQIIFEPEANFKNKKTLLENGFKLSSNPYLPTKTLQIDITKTNKEIITQMKKDGRYSLRKSTNIKVSEEKNIEMFRNNWFRVVGHKRHVLPINHLIAFKKSFKNNMILINWGSESGAMFLVSGDTAYYWIGFTSNRARQNLAQYQVIWKGILWSKKRGAKKFDFEGIYDERFPIKGWQGFTHFKKSFGGKVIIYPGSYLKWRMPL